MPTYIQLSSLCTSIHQSTYTFAFACKAIISQQRRLVKRYLRINQHADGWICMSIRKATSANEPSQRCWSYNAMPSSAYTASQPTTASQLHPSRSCIHPAKPALSIYLSMRSDSALCPSIQLPQPYAYLPIYLQHIDAYIHTYLLYIDICIYTTTIYCGKNKKASNAHTCAGKR